MAWFVVSVGLIAGLVLFGRPAVLADRGRASIAPAAHRVRVVIPCRNEEASIGTLLSDLTATVDPSVEIVVVDDHSTDATAEIVRRFGGVRLVRAPDLPDGWCGKPWACAVGAESGERLREDDVLVFLDADVSLAPGAFAAVVEERAARGGVVSVQPHHVVPTATEQLSAVFNLVSVMGIGAATPSPTGMFGPVVCCTAGAYRRVGGHGAVRDEVVEDMALARAFLRHRVPLGVLLGGPLVRFRMYPTGFAAMVEGWTKNMSTGAAATPILRRLGVGLWVAALFVAATLPLRAGSSIGLALGVGAYVAAATSFGLMLRRVGSFRWSTAALFPLAVAFFTVVFVRSVWCTRVRHSVEWRGRRIAVGAG